MAFKIFLENQHLVVENESTATKAAVLDLYSFRFDLLQTDEAVDYIKLTDASTTAVSMFLADAKDENGNTFATFNDLTDYLSDICKQAPNLGTNLRLDNIELSNTGSHLKLVNLNTGEQSFMVQQRVDPILGTTSVYYTEHTTEVQVETASDAYQPYTTHTGSGTLNAQNRYALPIDIQVIQDTFVHEYRSVLNTDIENLNIKIFNVTQSPTNLDDYNVLTGTDIVAGWYISKRPYWSLNKQASIDTKAGQTIASGNASLPFEEGFSLNAGEYYRFVISGDNDFIFQGVNGAPNPFGGTQFIPYIERSFTGEIEVAVKTEGAKIHTTALDFYRDGTNTTIILSDGESYPVNTIKAVADSGTIKIISVDPDVDITYYKQINHDLVSITNSLVGGSVTNVVNQLNQLFAVQPLALGGDYISTLPTLAGVTITGNFAEGQDPIGDSIYSVGTSTGQHDARVWSDETIDETGEFYEVKITGKGQFMLGLYSVNDGDLAEITNNSGNGHSGYKWANAFYNYGSYVAPWTTYGSNSGLSYGPGWNGSTTSQMRYNTIVQDNLANANPDNPVLFKVGINAQGYISVWYFDEGRSNTYIMTARSTYTLPEGEYGLMVKLVNGTVQLVELPTRTAVDPAAPVLTYRYVESNGFDYPLFASAEEANYYDSQNGGVGESSIVIYPDDATNTQWYRPANGFIQNAVSAPASTSEITYNEIPTTTLIPTAYPDTTIEVNEGETFNIQVAPAGADYGTTVNLSGNMWANYDGYSTLTGTAPTVIGDYNTNPNDEYTFSVTRTSEGSSTGTLTIRVINLTAPAVAISGFTWDNTSTPLADTNIMADGSVVTFDNPLNAPYRYVIPATWVQAYVLPALSSGDNGDKIYIGIKDGAGVLTDGIVDADFDAYMSWERIDEFSHKSTIYANTKDEVVINSMTQAFYDFAFEADDQGNLYVIACNFNSINTEPGVDYGGQFSRTVETTGTAPFTLSMVTEGLEMTYDEGDIIEIVIPIADNWIQVTESGNTLSFDGSTNFPTLQAGNTYRLLMGEHTWDDQVTDTHINATEIVKFTADGTTEYNMGATWVQSGTLGAGFAYIEFTVPTDVPPLHWYGSAAHNPISLNSAYNVPIAGSTYVVNVTGITLEGPVANQTGTNLFNDPSGTVIWGWLSIDEQLSAGERLVLNNAFLVDLTDAMPNNSMVAIGLKDANWLNSYRSNSNTTSFEGATRFEIYKYSSSDIRFYGYSQAGSFAKFVGTNGVSSQNVELALDLTSSGNNIRLMIGSSSNSTNNVSSTPYADWSSSYKIQSGDQGFGLTAVDVMVLGDGQTVGNLNKADGPMDSADVDWTLLSEINVPQPTTTTTPFNKVLDFSGSSERAQQVSSNTNYMPIAMDGLSASNTTAPTSGHTSGGIYSRPWACAIVFKIDGNSSNQHIWNQGEGAGSTDDNIYLRLDSNQNLYFGWGRTGALNECRIQTAISSGFWYAVYIGHDGRRWQAAGATAGNLYTSFDIHLMTSHDNFGTLYDVGTYNDWNQASSTTGGRMDRSVTGNLTIGGRGSNRNFHGKVASFVATTLRINQPMPDATEIELMIKDPLKWLQDYKYNQTFRRADSQAESTFVAGGGYSSAATQVWLMGDGIQDSYANGIRNQVWSGDQNYTKLNLISMVSNDIENTTIPGL